MNSNPRVAVSRRIYPELLAALQAQFDVVSNQDDVPLCSAELARRLADADGALIAAGERVDDTLLAACPHLKVVANVAVGYNNLDLAACTRHGVVATNTPDVLNESVADHGFALLQAFDAARDAVNRTAARGLSVALQGLRRYSGPQGGLAQTWPIGSMALWVLVLLVAYLVLYYL